jgi:(S)-3,5-dihydroxyphenylglycine transaminase
MVTVNTSPLSQAVIGGMLLEHGGSITAIGQKRSDLYRSNLALLLEELDKSLGSDGHGTRPAVTWNRPTGGFFVRMRLPVAADVTLLEKSASRYGVLWTPMSAFHIGDGGRDEIRLSCSYLAGDLIREGVARLAAFLRDLPTHDVDDPSARSSRVVCA